MNRCAMGVALALFACSTSASQLLVSSTGFQTEHSLPNAYVFNGFGCSGDNKSPALTWARAPAGTRSFALTVHDPDAPSGSGWWHWIVYDIPVDTLALPVDSGAPGGVHLPAGAVMGRNDFGARAYGGACPPAGAKPHRYVFTVYALKIKNLALPDDASAAMIGFSIKSNAIGSGQVIAVYGR